MKKILILGGTQFIGRNLVERLLEINEYDITLFNRQRTGSHLFPEVNKLQGDRETNDVAQISSQHWDYVIDLSCYYPDSLSRVLDNLTDLDNYIFISTCSVYDSESDTRVLKNEQSKILSCTPDQKTDRTPETYGNRKAECERILSNSGLPHLVLRPALVFGQYDTTDRLYYWLYQAREKKSLLLPEYGERVFSTTYVADLVETIIEVIQQKVIHRTYNVVTNPKTSIRQIVDLAQQSFKTDFSIVNGAAEFLLSNNISQWTDMPLWIHGDHFTFSNDKLRNELAIGVTEFKDSIEATISYYNSLNWPKPEYGLSEHSRLELIRKIRKSGQQSL
ncbi:MAG: SDR family oxidoreductase [Roseivirga sp.]